MTAKAKLSATTPHVGTLQPILPVVMRNDSRSLPQTYRGAWLQSKEIDGLTGPRQARPRQPAQLLG